jgi:rhamnosyl/mannosyltransferase
MRVLQFGKFYPPHIGGIEKVMFNITEGLNRRGIQCDVLCSNKECRYIEETDGGYSVTRTRTYGMLFSVSMTPQIIGKFRKIKDDYDIVHVHLPDPMAGLALLLSKPSAKVVLHWHSDIIRQRSLLRVYKPFQTWMLKRADAIIATSPNYMEGSPYLTPYRSKCHIVPIGVDISGMKVSQEKVTEIRQRFRGKTIVFSMGRLIHYKGYRYLIDAARHLGDEYVVLIAGSGALEGELRRQIDRSGLAEKVHMLGSVKFEDAGSYFEASDVFCLSSVTRNEAFGIVQIEAMLFRKPVVSTNIPGSGVLWANIDGETGLVVEPRDPEALAAGISRVARDQELYQRLVANGYRRASEMFTMDKMLDSTLKVYNSVM